MEITTCLHGNFIYFNYYIYHSRKIIYYYLCRFDVCFIFIGKMGLRITIILDSVNIFETLLFFHTEIGQSHTLFG